MHKPVLLQEVVKGLKLEAGETFLDGTFGGGGHSREVRREFGESVHIIGLDRDKRVKEENPEFDVRTESFRNLDTIGIDRVDAILFDLGISSDQLGELGRGFSFLRDEPLNMRMGSEGATAADILNTFSESALELILRGFGEEKYSGKIAREIVQRREIKPLETTFDLVAAVEVAKPKSWKDKIHPATKTFQALRIATNEELTALEEGLEKGFKVLSPGGRFAIISFHSLEDRLVKNFFRDQSKAGLAMLITKKPITPSEEELAINPRARSAKLRILKKI